MLSWFSDSRTGKQLSPHQNEVVFHEEDRVVLQGKDKRGVCSLVLKDIIEKIDGALEVCFWINMVYLLSELILNISEYMYMMLVLEMIGFMQKRN